METLITVAFVVALVVNYLQGYYGSKRRATGISERSRIGIVPATTLLGSNPEDLEQPITSGGDPFFTAEIPRDWLETALPRPAPDWAEQSIDWAEDRRFSESLESSRGSPIEDYHLSNDFGLINPATGLPMIGDGPFDIAGNPYGEDGSQHDWNSASHDSWSSDSDGSWSSTSSWDDNR